MRSEKNFISKVTFYMFAAVFFGGIAGCDSGNNRRQTTDGNRKESHRLSVFVSILPQKTFVQQIAGGRADVHVMVPPGRSPATYELTPRQLTSLENADIYFSIGVPFERSWLSRIKRVNPEMTIIDTSRDIKLRSFTDHLSLSTAGDNKNQQNHHKKGMKDPHIWLDPNLVKFQIRHIARALKNYNPAKAQFYDKNLTDFSKKLTELDQYISKRLEGLENRTLLVYHPSWGYFADAYDLQQIAIQHHGKEAGSKRLAQLISYMRKHSLKTIFVQKQFSQASAKAIAKSVNAEVVTLNPLPSDYISNMKHVADTIARAAETIP